MWCRIQCMVNQKMTIVKPYLEQTIVRASPVKPVEFDLEQPAVAAVFRIATVASGVKVGVGHLVKQDY